MSRAKRRKKKRKKLILGDDAIESFEVDWFDFRTPAIELAKQLYVISESSGMCCGIIGPWGSGKSSFMKLMEEYIREESSWEKVHTVWFTAWDPGGIQDLGDAMLYHFFRDVVGKNQEMANAFKELQQALGIRRSFRERAGRVIEGVSGTLPTPTGRTAAAVASSLLRELDAPRKVQRSFEKLMKWLEKEKRTVFFFIDDIDRATGEQIRDLLSELKLYISHRRIVAILGYSEDYVLGALKPALPSGIDPKKYLEKIVTIKRNVPIPTRAELRAYAEQLLHSMLDLDPRASEHLPRLGTLATMLSSNNPRRLKNLVLAFTQFLSSIEHKDPSYGKLASLLIASAAANMGFLVNSSIREAIESGHEGEIISAFEAFANEDSSKSKEAKVLIDTVNVIEPQFMPGTLSELRLPSAVVFPPSIKASMGTRRPEGFVWSVSLTPILSSAAMRGFKLTSKVIESSSEIVISPSTKTESLDVKYKEYPKRIQRFIVSSAPKSTRKRSCVLSWNQRNMIVLLTSNMPPLLPRKRRFLESFFINCAHFVAEKGFILWLIDDQGVFDEKHLKILIERAQEISKGLKHPFIFQYTASSKIKSLLTFLLSVAGKQS